MLRKGIKKRARNAFLICVFTCLFVLYVWLFGIRPDYIWHEQVIEEAMQDGWTLVYYSNASMDLFSPWTWVWPPISLLSFVDLSRAWVNQQDGSNIGLLPVLEISYNLNESKSRASSYILLVDLDDDTFAMWTADELQKMEESNVVPDLEKEKWYPNFISPDFEAAIWSIFEDWSVRVR